MHPSERQHQHEAQEAQTFAHAAALDNHVRLQQHQAEYLKWLEEVEARPQERYNFKKIR